MKLFHFVMLVLLAAHFTPGSFAEVIMSPPLGINKVTCLANSDTIVGIPFRKSGSRSTLISGTPTLAAGQAEGVTDLWVVPLTNLTLQADSLNTHYLHITSGTHDGRWYDIVANSTNSVTINLNGDDLTGVAQNDRVTIAEYGNLDTLYPPAQATTGWTEDPENLGTFVQNGHAIVGSNGTGSRSRKTEILYPDLIGLGINRAATKQYFIDLQSGEWKDSFDNSTANDIRLWPDVSFTIRHPSVISSSTIYAANGEVETNKMAILLASITTGKHDNFIAIPRPVDVALVDLNLGGTDAFVGSDGIGSRSRKDELLLVDNMIQGRNKAATKQYYFDTSGAGVWRDSFDNSDASLAVIPAGTGFVIRKSNSLTEATHFWQQTPSY